MSEHLAHYGVKGQKWGIRRFQNAGAILLGSAAYRQFVATGAGNLKELVRHAIS